LYPPDDESGKTFASGAVRAEQIFDALPTTRHRCNLEGGPGCKAAEMGTRSLVTPERVLSDYNEDLIFDFILLLYYF